MNGMQDGGRGVWMMDGSQGWIDVAAAGWMDEPTSECNGVMERVAAAASFVVMDRVVADLSPVAYFVLNIIVF